MKGPSFPILNKVINFLETIVRASSNDLCGILNDFLSAASCASMRLSSSFSSSKLPLNPLSVTYNVRCTSLTTSYGEQMAKIDIQG